MNASSGDRCRVRARLLCVVALMASAALVAACADGGSSDKQSPGSASNPLPALPNPTKTRTPPIADDPDAGSSRAKDAVRQTRPSLASQQHAAQRAATKRRAARSDQQARPTSAAPAGRSNGRRTMPSTTPVSARRPCTLVSKAQAQALIGTPIVEPLEAPQGPTCIYRSRAGKNFVTLAVQTLDFVKLRSQLRDSRRIDVSDRTGYCGSRGQPMLYVALAAGRVLSIAAPCRLARGFAAKAVRRLPAS